VNPPGWQANRSPAPVGARNTRSEVSGSTAVTTCPAAVSSCALLSFSTWLRSCGAEQAAGSRVQARTGQVGSHACTGTARRRAAVWLRGVCRRQARLPERRRSGAAAPHTPQARCRLLKQACTAKNSRPCRSPPSGPLWPPKAVPALLRWSRWSARLAAPTQPPPARRPLGGQAAAAPSPFLPARVNGAVGQQEAQAAQQPQWL